MNRHPGRNALALARELMALAREDANPIRLAIAHRALGYSLHNSGEHAEADALFSECVMLSDSIADAEFSVFGEHPGMIGRLYGGQTRCIIGFPVQGLALADTGLAHARARHSPHNLAWALVSSGLVRHILRDAVELERLALEAVELAREHRFPQWLAYGQVFLGHAMCSKGEPKGGISVQEEGIRSLHAAGSRHMDILVRTCLAESLIDVGELEKARVQLKASRSHFETSGEANYVVELERMEAELLRAEGAPSQEVAAQLKQAIGTARSQGARLFELRAATDLARLWHDEGRYTEAHALLAPIYGWFTEGFAMPDLRDAKALLDELR